MEHAHMPPAGHMATGGKKLETRDHLRTLKTASAQNQRHMCRQILAAAVCGAYGALLLSYPLLLTNMLHLCNLI